jgi:lysophospholipase L1-like esterase
MTDEQNARRARRREKSVLAVFNGLLTHLIGHTHNATLASLGAKQIEKGFCMTTTSRQVRRGMVAVTGAVVAIAAMTAAPAIATAGTHHPAAKKPLPVVAGSRYLALGDSVPFGYIESNATTAQDYSKPKNFIGYPEDVAANLGLKLTNAACPGETTDSFIDVKAQSNGCTNLPGTTAGGTPTPGGYRAANPLHTKYKSAAESQLAFAEAYLKKYPQTRLVSLMIGANDGFLCLEQSTDGCVSEFATLQQHIKHNAKIIFKGLRSTGYTGQIVVPTYYSMDYNSTIGNVQVQAVSKAVTDAGAKYGIEIADGFGQFEAAAAQASGDTCAAQLLTALTGDDAGTCGVHPSLAGQALLAQAVEQAIKK